MSDDLRFKPVIPVSEELVEKLAKLTHEGSFLLGRYALPMGMPWPEKLPWEMVDPRAKAIIKIPCRLRLELEAKIVELSEVGK